MKGRILSVAVVGFALGALAVEVGVGWKIVLPEKEDSGVYSAIRTAAHEMSDAFKDGAGWNIPVVESAQAPDKEAIVLGRRAAEKAGLSCGNLVDFDNVIAERDGNVYIF